MSDSKKFSRLTANAKDSLIAQMSKSGSGAGVSRRAPARRSVVAGIPDSMCDFSQLPGYKELKIHQTIAVQTGIMEPYFLCHDGLAKDTTRINGEEYLNFSTYDYLGLNGTERLNNAACEAVRKYGTSASASRLVSGERPPHRELERGLADFYGTEDCLAFVSGHATNIWTISQLLNRNDMIVYDALSHNSIIHGAKMSGAARFSYPHNDYDGLERLLSDSRASHKRCLIATEGLFSMDGDLPDLPRLIELKKRFKCFLMVDEAHALGVVGETGHGVAEHFGVDSGDVDIWMGTLSKSMCGCGGYIAGRKPLTEYLKYSAPGFVYSVGMPPAMAATSAEALRILVEEPERAKRVQELGGFFIQEAKRLGLDTGHGQGFAVAPLIVGNSLVAGLLSTAMHKRKVNVLPIIYPAVEDSAARLRFFLSYSHSKEQIAQALAIVAEELPKVRKLATSFSDESASN
ncbi:MAG: aminotransferase class I/II-fold pyridoxal phosphate-dependent enzyme [Pseudodesulfovibrio sp.]|uniref:aminotransferase class I/II-fold pyridoxal phosphate-dependent enzyme n=1 Tax=Pseudodesulfovibrio sp. TaxID=2035812 RepID=UPI003D0F393F